MPIKIYQSEVADGISEEIKTKNSIAVISTALPYTPTRQEEDCDPVLAVDAVAENKDQVDLYYLTSVLVSTGWNKNDDVFAPLELWSARNTPEDKQFNYMHNEDDIIGHITSNTVKDFTGKVVTDDISIDQIPDQFEIITGAVLYKSWSSAEKRERMAGLVAEIEEGKWFVSMECLFNNFDYAVTAPDGRNKIVARNEGSAFLTKHLRTYGGTGEYEGYKLGRLLKNIAFSGKGLVDKPANPRSVILHTSKPFADAKASEIDFIINSEEEKDNMADEHDLLQKQIEDLKQELATAKEQEQELYTKLEEMDEKSVSDQLEKLNDEIQAKDEVIATLEEAKQAWENDKKELVNQLAQKNEEFDAVQAKINEIETEAHKAKRVASLINAGLDDEEAQTKLEVFAEVSDEIFAEVVNLLANNEPVAEEAEADEDDTDDTSTAIHTSDYKGMKKGGKVVKKEETDEDDEDDADASADTETLEDVEVEVEAALAVDETDDVQSARATASDWLRKHVLKSTANLNDE